MRTWMRKAVDGTWRSYGIRCFQKSWWPCWFLKCNLCCWVCSYLRQGYGPRILPSKSVIAYGVLLPVWRVQHKSQDTGLGSFNNQENYPERVHLWDFNLSICISSCKGIDTNIHGDLVGIHYLFHCGVATIF